MSLGIRILGTASVAGMVLTGCGQSPSNADRYRPEGRGAVTIRVPANAPTIQAAVDAARPGDLVLVSPGTYRESVAIRSPRIVLRGTDRDQVVLDGGLSKSNGIVVTAPGVAVENLTVLRYRLNGVLVTGFPQGGTGHHDHGDTGPEEDPTGYPRLDTARHPPVRGFRVSYVTAANNGLYGVYAFDARDGQIDHTYTSGHADAGLYVGQCKPCNTLVIDNTAERNAVGYEGTNASGNLVVARNRFVNNRVGLTTNTDALEALAPQDGATIVGNVVAHNNAKATPEQAEGGFGIGVGVSGGTNNVITRNLVTGNQRAGIVVTNSDTFPPEGNRIADNRVTGNGVDLAYTPSTDYAGKGNCFTDNGHATSTPSAIERRMVCGQTKPITPGRLREGEAPPGIAFQDVTPPPAQPQLPAGATAPPQPASGLPPGIDIEEIPLPRSTGSPS